MSSITTPKTHHFFPLAWPKVIQINMPLSGVPEYLPEYKRAQLAAGATEYVFPDVSAPSRVDDILLEDALGDKRVLPNREAPREGPGRTTIFDHELFDYDVENRRMYFHKPLEKPVTMHWYCMEKAASFGQDWIEVSIKDMLIQGSNYIDQDLIPPNETQLTGKFQGSWRCFPEIVSLPTQGLVKKSNDTLGFSYRPRFGFVGLDSFEYLIYNSLGQVSDTYCFTFQIG